MPTFCNAFCASSLPLAALSICWKKAPSILLASSALPPASCNAPPKDAISPIARPVAAAKSLIASAIRSTPVANDANPMPAMIVPKPPKLLPNRSTAC